MRQFYTYYQEMGDVLSHYPDIKDALRVITPKKRECVKRERVEEALIIPLTKVLNYHHQYILEI